MPKPLAPCGTTSAYSRGCRCDECRAAQRLAGQKYRETHREQEDARVARWRAENPDRVKANGKAWKEANRDKVRDINLAWYHRQMEKDPESVRQYRREWAKTDKGRLANRLARHARRGAVSDKDYVEILLRDPCSYCGSVGGEIDHIDPISLGGTGEWDNLTSACRVCNARKNDQPLLAFVAG